MGFKFGDGLSYTTFETSLALSGGKADGAVTASVGVHNTGDRDGDEVVLVFGAPPNAGKGGAPLQVLLGYERVHTRAGERASVDVAIEPSKFQFADEDGILRDASGEWTVWVGPHRADTQPVALP